MNPKLTAIYRLEDRIRNYEADIEDSKATMKIGLKEDIPYWKATIALKKALINTWSRVLVELKKEEPKKVEETKQ